jgi:hypothetical protein
MRRTLLAVVVAVSVLGCGSSSSNSSDPVAACHNVFTTLCNKLFQCDPAGAAQAYQNASACASTLGANCSSAGSSCPSGTSYNAGNAQSCINDYGNESCTDIENGTTPASCSHVCT